MDDDKTYISNNYNLLTRDECLELLKFIYTSQDGSNAIQFKVNYTQVDIKQLPQSTITSIKNLIERKIKGRVI